VSPNRLEELPRVERSNQAWAADITYVPTKQGWTYLAVVLDLGTRVIKGWSLRDSFRTGLVCEAFQKAVFTHRPLPGLIHHSDRGGQYASKDFRRILETHKALSSMGKTGNCYDNAPPWNHSLRQ
jgi:putative transposase